MENFLIGLLSGTFLYGVYDWLIMWYDGLTMVENRPIQLQECDPDGNIVNTHDFPRNVDKIQLRCGEDTDE